MKLRLYEPRNKDTWPHPLRFALYLLTNSQCFIRLPNGKIVEADEKDIQPALDSISGEQLEVDL